MIVALRSKKTIFAPRNLQKMENSSHGATREMIFIAF
jgi:hypothetical protein